MSLSRNRREFLKLAAAAGLGSGAALSFDSLSAEARPSYRGRIIDTHTHFYDPSRPKGVPWPPPTDKLLNRRVLPADYQALPKPQPVSGTIVVEASAWLEDNQWILDLAATEPFIVGFVGNLPVGDRGFALNLRRFAANPLFRGLRIGAAQLRSGLAEMQFVENLKLVADRDLALDLLGGPEVLSDAARLGQLVPGLRLVIDHVANVRIDGQPVDATWHQGIRALAPYPNVFCKVSGLVEGTGKTDGMAPETVSFYKPVLDAIWNAFGEDRLVYGSNWPVSERFASCAIVQQLVTDFFSTKGDNALTKVFFRNSQHCYKWVERKSQ